MKWKKSRRIGVYEGGVCETVGLGNAGREGDRVLTLLRPNGWSSAVSSARSPSERQEPAETSTPRRTLWIRGTE